MVFAPAPAEISLSSAAPAPLTAPLVALDDLSFCYRPTLPPVLRGVNLTLAPGSFHFLTGPSGAGKTTLLRLLQLDLLPGGSVGGGKHTASAAAGGNLRVFGEDIATAGRELRARLRRRIGLVFQDFRLLDHLTVQENVALPLWLAGDTPEPLQLRAVTDMLAWVGLSEKLALPVAQLSGGEKQRVALARAVVHRPELVIADEPTGSVDAPMGRKIMHLLTELNKQGTTVVVATHDATLWQTYTFPVLRLENGVLTPPAGQRHRSAAGPSA